MTVDVQVRVGRIRYAFAQIRRGLLGAGAAVWAVGCVYGALPVPESKCRLLDEGGVMTRSLLIVEIVTGAALSIAIMATERDKPLAALGVVGALFALLALQDTGIAPFTHYLDRPYLSTSAAVTVVALWFATVALGAAGSAHIAAVGAGRRGRSAYAPPSRTRIPLSLLIGAAIGIGLAVPLCVNVWNTPDGCIIDYVVE